jgi:CheY-like chemotaxis protein
MNVPPAYIVEDLEDQRVLISLYLAKFLPGIPFILFESAMDLFTKLKEPHSAKLIPFIIVLDLNMPDIDGYQALQVLKSPSEPEHLWWKDVPVAMNSVLASPEMVQACNQLGAIAFISKSPYLQPLMDLLKATR